MKRFVMLFGYHQAPLQGIGNLRRSVASLSAGGIKQANLIPNRLPRLDGEEKKFEPAAITETEQ
jgi:hypothetical protein